MVASFFTVFDPELKVTAVKGKVFDSTDSRICKLKEMPEIAVFTETLEDYAMLQYKDHQVMGIVKGVQDNFEQLTSIDSILYGKGDFVLHDEVAEYGVMGVELMTLLGTGVQAVDPIDVYAPNREAKVNLANPAASFRSGQLFSPGVIFAVNQQKYDASYVLTSLGFARQLFGYTDEVSAVELRLKPEADLYKVQKQISELLGSDFVVRDRYEQQEDVFRIMEVEKLVSYLFLTFILLIASFNMVGSLSMLILDKKEDVKTLRNLGASDQLISRIFLMEGCMISSFGAMVGVALGLLLCYIQIQFGVISLGSADGSFVVDAYPVSIHVADILLVLLTVLCVGFVAVWYPVNYFSRRLLR